MMLRAPLSLLSPGGRRGRLSVLIFHRVLPEPDPLCPDLPDAGEFEVQMRWVRTWFNVLPLARAIDLLYAGRIPPRALAITFDDGYADNEELAAPILGRLGLTATFFVATGFLHGECMWNDRVIEAIRGCRAEVLDLSAQGLERYPLRDIAERRRAVWTIPRRIMHLEQMRREAIAGAIEGESGSSPVPRPMMRPEQVRNLRKLGMDVGAHTITHPILTRLSPGAARDEIGGAKEELERILGEPVQLFAYPNGVPGQDYTVEHSQMARECGFSAAVSTARGSASMRTDRFQIPRFTPWDRTRLRYGARLVLNLASPRPLAA
jgi:peptidoglycan/xylan/chitin deacetylase (PgdA/CDA1 family)